MAHEPVSMWCQEATDTGTAVGSAHRVLVKAVLCVQGLCAYTGYSSYTASNGVKISDPN